MIEDKIVLGVFLKNWQNLPVKTRLAKDLGRDSAKEVYCEMIKILHGTLQKYENASVLWCVAGGFTGLNSILGNNSELVTQSDGDLGQRMGNFCNSQFVQGAQKVLIIGTDSLYLDGTDFDLAIKNLETKRLVFQPSPDGGYTLVGMNRNTPDIFNEMPWSQSHLMQATIDRMQQFKFDYSLLEPRNDIDTLNDLREWYEDHNKSEIKDIKLENLLKLCRRFCI